MGIMLLKEGLTTAFQNKTIDMKNLFFLFLVFNVSLAFSQDLLTNQVLGEMLSEKVRFN